MGKDRLISILFILPSIILIAIFVYFFIGWTSWVSLVNWKDIFPDFTFVGLRNYARLFQNYRFTISLKNTIVFTALFLVASITLGLLLAILLDRKVRFEGFFRTIYLFPMAVSFVVTGVVWRWILNPGRVERVWV